MKNTPKTQQTINDDTTGNRGFEHAVRRNLLTALTAKEGIRSGGLAAVAAAFWAGSNPEHHFL